MKLMKKMEISYSLLKKNPSRWSINPEHHAQNTRAPTFAKEILLRLKSHIEPNTLIVGDSNTTLSPLDRSATDRNLEIRELTDVMIQINLTDIYRAFHPNTLYIIIHSQYLIEPFLKLTILSHKTNLNRYKKVEINSHMLPDPMA